MKQRTNWRAVLQLAGAFIAGMIGSGFATGQEVLQFFTSYGLRSYLVVFLCFALLLPVGHGLLRAGYENRVDPGFHALLFFGKKPLGMIYMVLMPIFLIVIFAVIVAGAGSTIYEYFGLSRYLGSAIIVFAALAAYLVGFEKLVKIVSMIGPLIIVFLLIVGIISILKTLPQAAEASQYFPALRPLQPTPWWVLSAVSYASMNMTVNAPYYAELGVTAPSKRESGLGAIFGSIALMLTIAITNSAILLSAQNSAQFDVPVLFLAKRISPAFGFLFCIFLVLGIFAACATTMWTLCHHLSGKNEKRGRLIAVLIALLTYGISFVPFARLVAVLYPLIGYLGIPLLVCIIVYEIRALIKKPSA